MIRLATASDILEIERLCLEFYRASPYRDIPESTEKVAEEISKFLFGDPTETIILLLVDSLGHPRGILAGGMSSVPFSNHKVAFESVWFVEEGFRGKESLTLLDVFEYWAKKNKANMVVMNLLNTGLKERLTKFYERKGYTECETSFAKYLGN